MSSIVFMTVHLKRIGIGIAGKVVVTIQSVASAVDQGIQENSGYGW
jgi:hypothetical protein